MKKSFLIIGALCAVAAATAVVLTRRGDKDRAVHEQAAPPQRLAPTRFVISTQGDPSLGPSDALVTVVELGDFQCTSTRDAAPMLRRVLAEYPAEVRLVWKDAPMSVHRHAVPAASLAEAVRERFGDAAFWKIHAAILARAEKLDAAQLVELAGEHGIEGAEAMRILTTVEAALGSDLSLARALHANSTPRLFVNGRPLQGGVRYASLKALIEEELAHARRLVSSGVSRERLPAALDAHAQIPREPPGPPPRIDREQREAQEEHQKLIEAMGRSEAFRIDDATLAALRERGITQEQIYEYLAQRTRVRWQLGPDAALAPTAQPK